LKADKFKNWRGTVVEKGIIRAAVSSKTNEWYTPRDLFDELNNEFKFTLDPCATAENAVVNKFYTVEDDGLAQCWENETVFMNPPYGGNTGAWIEKAQRESQRGATVVCLIPAATDRSYWHDTIFPYAAQIRFIRGRLKFGNAAVQAPFGCALVVFSETLNFKDFLVYYDVSVAAAQKKGVSMAGCTPSLNKNVSGSGTGFIRGVMADWEAPERLVRELGIEFGGFDLVIKSTDDETIYPWAEKRIFLSNNSEGRTGSRLHRALKASKAGATVVCLVNVATERDYWHDFILPHAAQIRFIRGRLRFQKNADSTAPFASAVVVFREAAFKNKITYYRKAFSAGEVIGPRPARFPERKRVLEF
jgi:site-specific DNA-methyltransferase (adenine-specific)